MNSSKKLLLIKAICWLGAAVDAFWVLVLLWPALLARLTGGHYPSDDLPLRLTAGIAACLMAGWTVLLAWAARNPVERRAVMFFTAIPVIAGLFCLALTSYFLRESSTEWLLVKLAGLFAAMLWAYMAARNINLEACDEIGE